MRNRPGTEDRRGAGHDGGLSSEMCEAVADGLVAFDRRLVVVFGNGAAARLFGIDRDDLPGTRLRALVPEELNSASLASLRDFTVTARPGEEWKSADLVAKAAQGGHFRLELALTATGPSGGTDRLLVGIFRPARASTHSERLWRANRRASRELAASDSSDDGMAVMLRVLGESVDWKAGLCWLPGEGGRLEPGHAWHANEAFARFTDALGDVVAGPGQFPGLEEPAWSDVAELDHRLAEAAASVGLRSSFAFPVREGQTLHGVLQFFDVLPPLPDEETRSLAVSAASQLIERRRWQRAMQALRQQEEHHRLALASAETGTWELDLETGRELWSDTLFRLYGLDPERHEPSYELWLGLLHPLDREYLDAKTRQLPRSGEVSFHDEFRIIHPQTGVRWMLSRGQVFYDSDGRGRWMRGTIVDITDRKLAEEEIQTLNRELEQRVKARTVDLAASNAELESFAYSVSHDLRAPLRGIDGFSQALLEDYGDKLDDQARGYIARVRAGAKRMGELIDDLLLLSRLSQQQLDPRPVDLGELAHDVASRLSEIDPERDVRFVIQPGTVGTGDPGLLRIVLENLIGNAWKFTRERERAEVSFGSVDRDGEKVFFVRDNGIGFDPRYSDRLFGAFQRLHGTDRFEGTGIGLATVKRIIRRHRGRVWAEGEIDGGATFYFTLFDPEE